MLKEIREFVNNPHSKVISDEFIDDVISYLEQGMEQNNLLAKKLQSNHFVSEDMNFSVNAKLDQIKRYQEQYDLLLMANCLGVWSWRCQIHEFSLDDTFLEHLGLGGRNFSGHVSEFLDRVHPDDLQYLLEGKENARRLESKEITFKTRILGKNNTWNWVKMNGIVIERDEKGYPSRYFGIVEDVTINHKRQEALKNLTQMDALTRCYNRLYFDMALTEERLKKDYNTLALVDVDYFKKFNDTYGHQVGDEVLKIVTKVMIDVIGEDGIVARVGGEEFGILLKNTSEYKIKTILQKVHENVKKQHLEKIDLRLKDVYITVTIGVAKFNMNTSKKEVYRKADKALYSGKNNGRDCIIYGDYNEK